MVGLWTFLAFAQTLAKLGIKMEDPHGIPAIVAQDFAAKWGKK